jgi:hypothetical protein
VSGFYDTTDIEDTGQYIKVDSVHYRSVEESDPEYELESSESDTCSEISLYDENEYEYE